MLGIWNYEKILTKTRHEVFENLENLAETLVMSGDVWQCLAMSFQTGRRGNRGVFHNGPKKYEVQYKSTIFSRKKCILQHFTFSEKSCQYFVKYGNLLKIEKFTSKGYSRIFQFLNF